MAWRKELFGMMDNGAEVERYVLTNENGVSASFLNLGGIWYSMEVPDKDSKLADVLLACADVETYLRQTAHFGEIVGRNANRIGDATFTLNGITYALILNDNGKNNLHSGPDYYRERLWDTEVEEDELGTRITFSLFSPDGDQGYPGNASIAVSYTLTPDNSVKIDYQMTADEDTIANLTNHAYFNLAGHNSGTALKHKLWIDADQFTPIDDGLIPTGEIADVKGTPMDFTVMKPIGQDIDADFESLRFGGGYDHNWCLNHREGELSLVVKVMEEESGRMMEVYTDLPGIQFYAGNFLDNDPGKDGAIYQKRDGFCLETQLYPNAINRPQFSSPVLKAGEEYRTTTIYHFAIAE